MSRRWVIALGMLLATAPAAGQAAALERAVEAARVAWLAHDTRALVAASDTVRLRVPGVASSQALRPAQAARVLSGWLANADEIALSLSGVRSVADDHAYAELRRTHVVRGTTEQRLETVFLGFRRIDGIWRLREIRITR